MTEPKPNPTSDAHSNEQRIADLQQELAELKQAMRDTEVELRGGLLHYIRFVERRYDLGKTREPRDAP